MVSPSLAGPAQADGEFRARKRWTLAAGRLVRLAARHLSRTTLFPGDETCFHVFEAASHNAVAADACRLAGLETVRIVPAVE